MKILEMLDRKITKLMEMASCGNKSNYSNRTFVSSSRQNFDLSYLLHLTFTLFINNKLHSNGWRLSGLSFGEEGGGG